MMKYSPILLSALGSLLLACGSSDDDSTNNGPVTGTPTGTVPGGTTTAPGTTTDPGVIDPGMATALPCTIDSGYEGDELCILPPAAGEGIQIHAGPPDYDDPIGIAPYLVAPGVENVLCFGAPISESDFYYLRQQNRMRSGSHHMLIGIEPTGGGPSVPGGRCGIAGSLGSIPGAQTPARDMPDELGPEDAGLARYMPPDAGVAAFQMHYVNTGDTTLMREAWVNLYWMPEEEALQRLQGIFLLGDLSVNVPPYTRQTTTLSYTPQLTEPVRIFALNGHSHAHAESFTVTRIRGADRQLVYQSFNWAEPIELTLNTVVQNPLPDAATLRDGGASGLLYLEPGDTLEWACDVNNTTAAPLGFANEAYTAEMCLLTGGYISNTGGLISGGCAGGGCIGGFAATL